MRFNHRELVQYAASKAGSADKEGCLWMKEGAKKKESECIHVTPFS